jgi:protein NrfD
MVREKIANNLAWIIGLGLLVIGFPGIMDRIEFGHQHAAYGSYIPWGLWISSYIWFIGLSAGALLVSVFVYVFHVESLKKVGKMAFLVAIVTLIGAMLSVGLDLGHITRAFTMPFHANLHSMMGWMSILYPTYFATLCLELFFALKFDAAKSEEEIQKYKKILWGLGVWSIPLAIAFHGGVGGLFANVIAKPWWHGPILPIVFLVGAFLSGTALSAFVLYIWRASSQSSQEFKTMLIFLGKVTLFLLIADEFLELSEVYIGQFYSQFGEGLLWSEVLHGDKWYVFWVVHILLGVVIPGYLLIVKSKSPAAIAIAGLMIAISFLAVRLNIVIPGMLEPELPGLDKAWVNAKLTYNYVPTLMEWQVLLFITGVVITAFMLGKKLLPIYKSEGVTQ